MCCGVFSSAFLACCPSFKCCLALSRSPANRSSLGPSNSTPPALSFFGGSLRPPFSCGELEISIALGSFVFLLGRTAADDADFSYSISGFIDTRGGADDVGPIAAPTVGLAASRESSAVDPPLLDSEISIPALRGTGDSSECAPLVPTVPASEVPSSSARSPSVDDSELVSGAGVPDRDRKSEPGTVCSNPTVRRECCASTLHSSGCFARGRWDAFGALEAPATDTVSSPS